MNIQELFQEDIQIPSLPEIFYQFKEVMDDPDSSFEEIGNIVGHDPGLTARLLKIVNSAFFGFPQQVETISHAIGIVGREPLTDLVLSTVVMDQFNDIPQSSMNMKSFWKHSIACGLAARIVASQKKETNPEQFFVAGLLHDIGLMALCITQPSLFLDAALRSKFKKETLHTAETEIMGFNHADVGGFLLKTWKLSKVLEEAVGFHHNPAGASQYSLEASVIHIADILADDSHSLKLGLSTEVSTTHPTLDEDALKCIELPADVYLSTIRRQMEKEFEQTVQIFLQTA